MAQVCRSFSASAPKHIKYGVAPFTMCYAHRPDHTEHAKMARWLVHSSDWGVLASTATDGTPVG
jgi:hypothetical protein